MKTEYLFVIYTILYICLFVYGVIISGVESFEQQESINSTDKMNTFYAIFGLASIVQCVMIVWCVIKLIME